MGKIRHMNMKKSEPILKYVVKNVPAAGNLAKDLEDPDQLKL